MNADGSFDYDPNGQFDSLGVGQTATDTFSYTIDDSQAQPNSTDTANVTVTISGVNDAPDLNLDADDSGGFSPFFAAIFEAALATPVAIADSDLQISDIDSATIASATVTITNRPDGNNELLAATPSGAITAGDISFDAASGILTISPAGGASLADFQQVLRSVTYNNIAVAPTTSVNRLVTFVVNDGLLSSPIRISAVAVLPPLTVDLDGSAAGTGFTAGFVEDGSGPGSGPVPIVDTDVIIVAPNNLVRATVTLTNRLDGPVEGLNVNEFALPSAISLDGASTATNVILTSAGASAAEFQTALRLIEYNNNSEDPSLANRLVSIVLEDDTAAVSNTAVATISISESNDAPVAQNDDFAVDEDTAVSGDVLADNGSGPDTDLDDSLTVTQVNGAGFTTGRPSHSPRARC